MRLTSLGQFRLFLSIFSGLRRLLISLPISTGSQTTMSLVFSGRVALGWVFGSSRGFGAGLRWSGFLSSLTICWSQFRGAIFDVLPTSGRRSLRGNFSRASSFLRSGGFSCQEMTWVRTKLFSETKEVLCKKSAYNSDDEKNERKKEQELFLGWIKFCVRKIHWTWNVSKHFCNFLSNPQCKN